MLNKCEKLLVIITAYSQLVSTYSIVSLPKCYLSFGIWMDASYVQTTVISTAEYIKIPNTPPPDLRILQSFGRSKTSHFNESHQKIVSKLLERVQAIDNSVISPNQRNYQNLLGKVLFKNIGSQIPTQNE